MTDFLSQTNPVHGGIVSQHSTPDFSVDVTAGFALIQNQMVVFSAATLPVTFAHAAYGRIDLVLVDSAAALSVLAGTADADGHVFPPDYDTDVYALLAEVNVVSQVDPSYTGTIVDAAIRTSAVVSYVVLPQPGQTFAYTFDTGTANSDPGATYFRFNGTTWAGITAMYLSDTSPTFPLTGYGGVRGWIQNTTKPFYLRIWSRSRPDNWWLVEVTAYTSHTNYFEVAITDVNDHSGHGLAGPNFETDLYDVIFEYIGPVQGSDVTSVFGRTGAVVAVVGDYDGNLLGIRNFLNGTTSYTPTSGTGIMYVECQAGGAGTRAGGASTCVGGSGGGAYSASKITAVNSGAHTIAIGAGGTTAPTAGGDTSMTLVGGESGTAPLAKGGSTSGVSNAKHATGGVGGLASSGTGDITADGGGGNASCWSATDTFGIGGAGGFSFFGAGANGVAGGVNSNPGGLYGGGASGNSNKATSSAAGGNGLMRITEYT